MQTKSDMLEKVLFDQYAGRFLSASPFFACQFQLLISFLAVMRDGEVSQMKVSSSSGLGCNIDNLPATSSDQTSICEGLNIDQLSKARNLGILKLSPGDEVEGALLYYQQQLLCNATMRKRISGLYSKPVSISSVFLFLWHFSAHCVVD